MKMNSSRVGQTCITLIFLDLFLNLKNEKFNFEKNKSENMPNKHANIVDIFKYIILEKKMQS